MSVLSLRDELVTRFGAIDGVRDAVPHDQDFGLDELNRVGGDGTPRVLVTPMELLSGDEISGVAWYEWAAVVITRPGDVHWTGLEADALKSQGDAAALIASRIVRELRGGGFTEGCQRPRKVRAGNMSNAAKGRHDVTIWAVTWAQAAELDDNVVLELVDLDTIATEMDITGDGEPDATTAAGGPYEVEEDGTTKVLDENDEPIRTESLD